MVGGDPKNKNKKKGLIHTPTLDTQSQISHVTEDPMWEDPPWSTRGKKIEHLHLGIVWTLQAHMPICTWAIQVSASNWLHRVLSLLSLLENLHRSTNGNTIKMNWILKGASQETSINSQSLCLGKMKEYNISIMGWKRLKKYGGVVLAQNQKHFLFLHGMATLGY